MDSARLLGTFHADPAADRMIVATARALDACLMTTDDKILSAGGLGRIKVATALHVGRNPIKGGTTVVFYDGNPAKGGKVFDRERVVHLRAGDIYQVRVPSPTVDLIG